MTALALDATYQRPRGGRTVVGGSPLRLFRLTPAGAGLLAALEAGELDTAGLRGPAAQLVDRLVDAGVAHPVPVLEPGPANAITLVVPARGAWPGWLRHGPAPTSVAPAAAVPVGVRVLVVDDASDPPLVAPADVAPWVEVVRLEHNRGPGGARDAGLAEVATPFVAFVDGDVDGDAAGIERLVRCLLPHFDDARVALVAPRIRATPAAGALARYEQRHNPLDLGDRPARVSAGTRVSYVPAAVVVARVAAVREVGGFDPALRWGEDVDLVWRLAGAGWRCRYEPRVAAEHRTRGDLGSWLAQRFRYGTSAAPLARRHRGALAPLRMNGWTAAAWAVALVGPRRAGPLAGMGLAAATSVVLVRKVPDLPPVTALRLAASGHLTAGAQLAAALRRTWWPAAIVAALVSRRARRLLVVAVVVPTLLDRGDLPGDRGAGLDLPRHLALRVLDDAAYGAGVWAGVLRHGAAGQVLLPSLERWPPPSRPGAGRAHGTATVGGR